MNESSIRKAKWPDLYGTAACPDVNGKPKLLTRASGNHMPAGKLTFVLSKRDHARLAAKKANMEKMQQDAERLGSAR